MSSFYKKTGNHLLSLFTVLAFLFLSGCGPAEEGTSIRFEISLEDEAALEISDFGLEVPISGRVFAIISDEKKTEPRLGTGVTGNPLWGMEVEGFAPGKKVIIEDNKEGIWGYPFEKTRELPPGEYFIQAFLNIYTTFHRSDGHTVKMHLNSGAHQNAFRAPGNAYSDVKKITIEPNQNKTVSLPLNKIIQPEKS